MGSQKYYLEGPMTDPTMPWGLWSHEQCPLNLLEIPPNNGSFVPIYKSINLQYIKDSTTPELIFNQQKDTTLLSIHVITSSPFYPHHIPILSPSGGNNHQPTPAPLSEVAWPIHCSVLQTIRISGILLETSALSRSCHDKKRDVEKKMQIYQKLKNVARCC